MWFSQQWKEIRVSPASIFIHVVPQCFSIRAVAKLSFFIHEISPICDQIINTEPCLSFSHHHREPCGKTREDVFWFSTSGHHGSSITGFSVPILSCLTAGRCQSVNTPTCMSREINVSIWQLIRSRTFTIRHVPFFVYSRMYNNWV